MNREYSIAATAITLWTPLLNATAYDGFLEPSGSKARKATKAAKAGIAKSSTAACAPAVRKQKPLAKKTPHDAHASGAAKRKTGSGESRKQLLKHAVPSITASQVKPPRDESPGPAPQAAVDQRAQGRRPRPASKLDKANRIAHKKLKLAYLARVQRTLAAANKVCK